MKSGVWMALLFVCTWTGIQAQSPLEVFPKGGRSMGMGNAHTTLADPWAIFNNIGALAEIKESQAAFSYDHRMQLNELSTLAALVAIKKNHLGLGIGVSQFGDKDFSQSQAGLGIAHRLGIASLGLKINYFQTHVNGYGTAGTAVLEFGGLAELSPVVFFGAHVYNPTMASYGGDSPEKLPTIVKAGISYRPSDKVSANLDAEKDILLPAQLKIGVEYSILQRLWLRVGFNTNPERAFYGIGFRPRRFHIDYAMTQHHRLGFTHHFSFSYLFVRK
jgi:hypothetical protein